MTLIDTHPQKIPTGTRRPPEHNGQPTAALLMGCYSVGLKGLFVLPRLIDSDYTGEICIIAYTLFPPLVVPARSRIAQLVLFPTLTQKMDTSGLPPWGATGFGSTRGMALLTIGMRD